MEDSGGNVVVVAHGGPSELVVGAASSSSGSFPMISRPGHNGYQGFFQFVNGFPLFVPGHGAPPLIFGAGAGGDPGTAGSDGYVLISW